jgi:ferredoxin-type protein NapH
MADRVKGRERRSRRQVLRRLALILTLLLFPVALNYMSPYLIVDASARGIVNGSLLVFAALFVLSLFVGRLWCAWVCPGAGLQEFCAAVVGRPARRGWNAVKWVVWVPWVTAIAILAVRAGGYSRVAPLYMTDGGISVVHPRSYVIYYSVLALILALTLSVGRRGFCHSFCWMAPFMIVGRGLRNLAKWPALRLHARPDLCTECGLCTRACPMGLSIGEHAKAGRPENAECILCAECVDVCPKGALSLVFGSGRD